MECWYIKHDSEKTDTVATILAENGVECWVISWKLLFNGWGKESLVGRKCKFGWGILLGREFFVVEGISKFLAHRGLPFISYPPVGKTLHYNTWFSWYFTFIKENMLINNLSFVIIIKLGLSVPVLMIAGVFKVWNY